MLLATLAITASLCIPADVCCLPSERTVASLVVAAWQEAEQTPAISPQHQRDLDADIELGRKYAAEVDKQVTLSSDEEMIERVKRIGSELAAIANNHKVEVSWGDKRLNPFPYEFKVIESPDINAFALPGGVIYVHDALVKFCESDDELAGVLAHEISHSSFRHVAQWQRESNKLTWTIPLILAALVLGGRDGANAAMGINLGQTAITSGWSQKAEQSADWGGIQYLVKSSYNPVGALTFMERLAMKERANPFLRDLGIFRTHPPSRERAEMMIAHLQTLEIPIRRSEVTQTYRVQLEPQESGTVEVKFMDRILHTFGGADAASRAQEASKRLNEFFDSVPELSDVTLRHGNVYAMRELLFEVTDDDAAVAGASREEVGAETVRRMKRAMFMLGFRIWDISG